MFNSAFIQKNDLFPPPNLSRDGPDTEPVDLNVVMKMAAMMEGIEHRTRHKAIGDGKE